MQLRRQHRIAYQTRIRLRTPDRDESVVARVQNLSPHGVFVLSSDMPDAGTEVICRLDLGGLHRTVRGRIAWVRQPSASTPDKSPGAGIEFLDLDEKDAELLNRVVEPDPRDSKPVDVWFEGMAAPIRCQAAVLGEGVRLATRLPFLRLNSTVRVSFGPNGGGNEEGTLDAVVLEPSSEDGVPRLQLNVSLVGRERAAAGSALEYDLDSDPDVQIAPVSASEGTEPTASGGSSDIGSALEHPPATLAPLAIAPAEVVETPPPVVQPPVIAPAPVVEAQPAEELPPTPIVSAESDDTASGPSPVPGESGLDEASHEAEAAYAAAGKTPAPEGGREDEDQRLEAPAEGAAPLVSHMMRLGPPPLPALRHRRQGPDAEKTPTVSDASTPQTIPPMTLSGPLARQQKRRVNVWGLGAVAIAAAVLLVAVTSQRRGGTAPPPAATAAARPPEATPMNETGTPSGAPGTKPPATPPAPAAVAPAVPISVAKKGTLTVQTSGNTSRFVLPLSGSSRGARRALLTQPPGVSLLLPRGRVKVAPGTYKPAGDQLTVQVTSKGPGSEVRFMYDPGGNDATMKLESRKVTLQLVKKP